MSSPLPSPSRRSRSLAIAAFLAIAAGSGLAGAAIDRAYVHQTMRFIGDTSFHPISSSLRAPTAADRKQFLAELSGALSLSTEQNRVIDSIISHRASQFNDLREAMRPRVEGLLSEVRSDIERVLSDNQRDRYRKLQGRSAAPTPVAGTTR
jgi:2'-5' RNA ligase